jgi:hypothetical protein
MKSIKNQFVIFLFLISIVSCRKETGDLIEIKRADFELLALKNSTYWNGSDKAGKFASGGLTFENNYNTLFGSWDGFALSQKADVTTAGYGNQYSVFDISNGANNFAIYYPPFGSDAFASFPTGSEYIINSISICNSTYTALTMKIGDPNFAKKFGGVSGNDPDWYKVTAIGYNAAGDSVKSADFYLADYRAADNSKDYIVNKWTTFNLSSLGKINKLTFRFSSTDNGSWGMNTPAYVCLDDLKYEQVMK